MLKTRPTLGLCLILLVGCAPAQPLPQQYRQPAFRPTIEHSAAKGCRGEHDTVYLAGCHINAYPVWPPNAQPEHIVLHYDNSGEVIWGKPSYGAPECTDYMTCRRATFILNPTWNQCTPQGHLFEVITLDGKPVLESSLLQIIDPTTRGTAYVAFACGRGFAGPSVTSVADQIQRSGCFSGAAPTQAAPQLSQDHPFLNAAVQAVGMTLAAAAVLGTAYFEYRAAAAEARAQTTYTAPVCCTTIQVGQMWQTTCH